MRLLILLALFLAGAPRAQTTFWATPVQCPDPVFGVPGGNGPNTMNVAATSVRIGANIPITVFVCPFPSAAYVIEASLGVLGDVGPVVLQDWSSMLPGWSSFGSSCLVYAQDVTLFSGIGFYGVASTHTWAVPVNTALIGYPVALQAFVACSGCPFGVAPTNAWGDVIR